MDNNGIVKKKVLIFGATGYLGVYMVKACVAAGHITYAYTRPLASNPGGHDVKSEALQEFKAMGVTLVQVCSHINPQSISSWLLLNLQGDDCVIVVKIMLISIKYIWSNLFHNVSIESSIYSPWHMV